MDKIVERNKKNLAIFLDGQPKVKITILSFSLESLKRETARATKKAIGVVKIKILGSINKYNLKSSELFISIKEVIFAICIKKTIDIIKNKTLKSEAKLLIKLDSKYLFILFILGSFYLLFMHTLQNLKTLKSKH